MAFFLNLSKSRRQDILVIVFGLALIGIAKTMA